MNDTKWSLKDTAKALKNTSIQQTSLSALDLASRVATFSNGNSVAYKYLVLAPGSVSDTAKIPGLSDFVDVCNSEHVERAKSELEAFVQKAKDVKGETDAKAMFLVVIGSVPYKCPPLPFEIASLVDYQLRQAGARKGQGY